MKFWTFFAAKDSGINGHTPIFVSVMLYRKSCKMQFDTGATVSILPKVLYNNQFNQLRGTKIMFKAYNGVQTSVYSEVHLPVVYEQQGLVLPLVVGDDDGPLLLGRIWLEQLKLNCA